MKETARLLVGALLVLRLGAPALMAAESQGSALVTTAADKAKKETAYRLKWNLDTLVGDYERHGHHSAKWDESAKSALTLFAQIRADPYGPKLGELVAKMTTAVAAAGTNGCDDPLMLYLSARFLTPQDRHSCKEHGEQYRRAAEGLSHGQYAPIRKFYAALRAAEALHPGGTGTPAEVHHWRREASRFLNEAVADKAMPPGEVYEACDALLQLVKKNDPQLEQFYHSLEPSIFKNWPSESCLYLLKGFFYSEYAWQARGSTYAPDVTSSGWTLFAERLAEAEKALAKAWDLNPRDERIARQMLTVELGQGKGRARMELWFKRATDLNTNYYEACSAKLYYLEPKWYGSAEDMLDFGHECLSSKKWGGRIPLIMVDAHEKVRNHLPANEQPGYWTRPEVWKDVNAAFQKFFRLNPQEISWRHNYARYAYRAEDWTVLNQQIPLLGEINYEYFGGKDEYEKMLTLARQHAKGK